MIRKVFSFVVLLALFGACTQDDPRTVDQIKDDQVLTERSSAAECDSIQDSLPTNATCDELAELLECRLNQGVDEELTTQCDHIDDYTFRSDCLTQTEIETNYQSLQQDYQLEVNNNTDDCPPCANPGTYTGCKTIIFTIISNQECADPDESCQFRIRGDVFCCDS